MNWVTGKSDMQWNCSDLLLKGRVTLLLNAPIRSDALILIPTRDNNISTHSNAFIQHVFFPHIQHTKLYALTRSGVKRYRLASRPQGVVVNLRDLSMSTSLFLALASASACPLSTLSTISTA